MEIIAESNRKKQKAETRLRIITEAVRVFAEKGFIATTTPDIAKAAGVSHGSVFAHFKSKEDLLIEVVESFLTQADKETRRAIKSCGSLKEVLMAHIAAMTPYEQLYAHLIRESHAMPKQLRALLTEINSAVSSHIMTVLDRQGYKGLPKTKRFFVFNTWFGTLSHYLLNRDLFVTSGSVLEQHGDQIVRLFLCFIQFNERELK